MRDYEIMHDELVKRLDRIISILETLLSHTEHSKRRPEKETINKCLCNVDKSVCPVHPAT